MSGSLLPVSQQWFDNNGNPLAGGKVFTYIAGTSTPKNSYADYALSALNTNPVILDAAVSNAAHASVQLNNTKVVYDLLGLVETSGEGIFSVYNGDYQFRRDGGPSVSGAVTVDPKVDTDLTFIDASTVTIANTNQMHKGKRLRLLCLTSNGVTVALASGSFNFGGLAVPVIHMNMVDSYLELRGTTSGWEIVGSTQYVPARIRQIEVSGTNGGGFTAGSFVARTFNEEFDPSVFVGTTGASWTQFVLQPGVYSIRAAAAPAFGVNKHQLRIQNITAGTTLATGVAVTAALAAATPGVETPGQVATSGAAQSVAEVEHTFNITAATTIEIQHRCQTTNAVDGFGMASSFGGEVFASCIIEKHI